MSNIIDVIITTSHGRDKDLYYCLKALTLQEFKDFSVIISDDGSYDNTPKIIKEFKNYFPLTYIWRKNDLKPGRSRNLAVKLSKGQFLIFIDSDVLLNNKAVLKYNSLLNLDTNLSIWGKCGTSNIIENSEIFPDIKVVKKDVRQFLFDNQDIKNDLPYENTWAGNFGISRENFLKVGGFNEQFCGWGCEDSEFGWRLFSNKIKICFKSEVWGEHFFHEHNNSRFYDSELVNNNKSLYYKIIDKNNPDSYYSFFGLGTFYFSLRNYEKAKYYYDKCLKINPFSSIIHYNLSLIYLKEKDFNKTVSSLQKVLKIDPNHKQARFILENILSKFMIF